MTPDFSKKFPTFKDKDKRPSKTSVQKRSPEIEISLTVRVTIRFLGEIPPLSKNSAAFEMKDVAPIRQCVESV